MRQRHPFILPLGYSEAAMFLRSPLEIAGVLRSGNIGTVETAAAPAHLLVDHYVPEIRKVVVRRRTEDVVKSMMAIDLRGLWTYDKAKVEKVMAYGNRLLDQISAKPGVETVDFEDLETPEACARIFEFCLPYEFDRAWWEKMRARNIQAEQVDTLTYYTANKEAIVRFKKDLKMDLRRLYKAGQIKRELV